MRGPMYCLLFAVIWLAQPAVSCAGLVISEVMSAPSSKADDVEKDSDEWFEIFNSSGAARDLSEIQYDTDDDAIDGVSLSGKLASGACSIVANQSVDLWQELYGKLPKETLFIQVDSPWKVLSDKAESLLAPGGASGDFHSAGISNLQVAQELSAVALLGLAGLGLVIATRRQCLHAIAMA